MDVLPPCRPVSPKRFNSILVKPTQLPNPIPLSQVQVSRGNLTRFPDPLHVSRETRQGDPQLISTFKVSEWGVGVSRANFLGLQFILQAPLYFWGFMYFLGLRMYLVQSTFSPPPCTSSAATSTVGGSEHWCWRWGWRTWRHYDMLALTKNCQSGVQIVKCICLKISDGTHTEPIKWLWRVEEVPLRC